MFIDHQMTDFPLSDYSPWFIHWEGSPLYCAHSGRAIESAYGEPE